jgi:hypothetical protein
MVGRREAVSICPTLASTGEGLPGIEDLVSIAKPLSRHNAGCWCYVMFLHVLLLFLS